MGFTGELAVLADGVGVPALVRERDRVRDRRGPGAGGHRRLPARRPRARAAARVDRPAAAHGHLHPRPRGPRVRRRAVRGRGRGARLACAARGRARERAPPVRPLRAHRRLQRRDQRAPVRAARADLPVRVPGSGRAVRRRARRSRWAASASSCTTPRARPTTTPGSGCPDRKILCCGDLFIWATPNAGNPQKAQRHPREWAQALRRMAELGAETMLPGHGPPLVGADRVQAALTDTAALLESLVEQTLALMNEGAPLDQIVQSVRAPAELLARPYLRPIYDEPEFIVRNLWRLYGGWYDGDPVAPQARAGAGAGGRAGRAGGRGRPAGRARARAGGGGRPAAGRAPGRAGRAGGPGASRPPRRRAPR